MCVCVLRSNDVTSYCASFSTLRTLFYTQVHTHTNTREKRLPKYFAGPRLCALCLLLKENVCLCVCAHARHLEYPYECLCVCWCAWCLCVRTRIRIHTHTITSTHMAGTCTHRMQKYQHIHPRYLLWEKEGTWKSTLTNIISAYERVSKRTRMHMFCGSCMQYVWPDNRRLKLDVRAQGEGVDVPL